MPAFALIIDKHPKKTHAEHRPGYYRRQEANPYPPPGNPLAIFPFQADSPGTHSQGLSVHPTPTEIQETNPEEI